MEDNFSFSGLYYQADLNNARKKNIEQAKNQAQLKKQIDKVFSLPDGQKEKALSILVNNKEMLQSLCSDNLMYLFTKLRGHFDLMIQLYNNSSNKVFSDSLMVQEQLLVAYNKTNNPDKSIELGLSLVQSGRISGDVFGGLGKAYLMKSQNAQNKEEKMQYLSLSAVYYEQGFISFCEFYPGINATYRYIDLGDFKKAQELAKIVYLSTLKEGAESTTDYWCASTRVEAACVAGFSQEEIDKALNYLLTLDAESWAIDSTITTLQNVNKTYKSDKVAYVINKLVEKQQGIEEPEQVPELNDQKLHAIQSKSYNYRGLASNFQGSSSVGGNMRFGGQLPDHSISRKDVEFFDGILQTPLKDLFPEGEFEKLYAEELGKNIVQANLTLNQITSTKAFLKVIDKFIRYHFGTENFANTGLHLENNAEINNSDYDKAVKGLLEVSGKKGSRQADSRTNISALFALGLGDCRHHAQVKQLLFDRWQNKKMNNILSQMQKNGITEELVRDFYDIHNVELRTFDVEVHVPIELEGMYSPVKGEDGKYIYNPRQQTTLEEHTMTVLIKKSNGKLSDIKLADAFYQEHYDWSYMHIDIDKDITLDGNGNYMIHAGDLSRELIDKDGVPIVIQPTVYAGKRDKYNMDEHGNNVKLLGLPININNTEQMVKALKNRKMLAKYLVEIHDFQPEENLKR